MTHPDPAKLALGYRLKHCCLEAPTRGENMYIYSVTTTAPDERFTLDLPDYWPFLNENPRVFMSNGDTLGGRYAAVASNAVVGVCELPGTYNVMVIGTRRDQGAVDGFDGAEYIAS